MDNSGERVLGRGKYETERLRDNIQGQLDRLLTQLEDLEQLRDQFEPQEYLEMETETHEQLVQFNAFLDKSLQGDISLINEFDSAQLAIQAAVSSAFKTPEIIRLFAEKQPEAIRHLLSQLKRDVKLRSISSEQYESQTLEGLIALSKLVEKLTLSEKVLLDKLSENTHLEMVLGSEGSLDMDTMDSLRLAASSDISRHL